MVGWLNQVLTGHLLVSSGTLGRPGRSSVACHCFIQMLSLNRDVKPFPTTMSIALDALIFVTGWTHVILSPYTKVEESFNLHATHDVLMYGVRDLSKVRRPLLKLEILKYPCL